MKKSINIQLLPWQAQSPDTLKEIVAANLAIKADRISHINVLRRSIDARTRNIKLNLRLDVFIDEHPTPDEGFEPNYQDVSSKPEILVIGAGPAGLFAALKLIELGLKPVLIERGKDIKMRKRDIAGLNRNKHFDPESNYCFGEGGAGTFSDGKLYTRSKKRGSIEKILQVFCYHGATPDILIDAHPHIGTDKLPAIITAMRESILQAGGEIHFETRMDDLILKNDAIEGILTAKNDKILSDNLILATGHSARDVYYMLHKHQIILQPKAFAMGLRVEHPQVLIDDIQYHGQERGDYLPAATYNLATQINRRGVYSFCMCPGGYVVPATTEENATVVNGMSPSKRHSDFANAGIVVEVKLEDLNDYSEHGIMAGLAYQKQLEEMAFLNGGKQQTAPAQGLADFVNGQLTKTLIPYSYLPGLISSPLHFWLPETISQSLREAFKKFNKKMKGYLTNDAIVIGVESRTSSPLTIPRDPDTLEHPQIKGLYPCGEGAGHAGGIVSSAMDGERCAQEIYKKLKAQKQI